MFIPIEILKCLAWLGGIVALLICFIIGFWLGAASAEKDQDWH